MAGTVIGGLNAEKIIRQAECFDVYEKDPEQDLPIKEVMTYVVLLYTKDSFLNKKPMDPLKERRVKAANIAGLSWESDTVKEKLFELGSEKIRELILGYLIHQNQMIWAERCIIEAQIIENQRIRFKPITNKISVPNGKDNGKSLEVEADDKYIVEASSKKSTLTDHFTKYYDLLKKYDLEIFQDHEDVKAAVKKTRTTIESVAQ